METEQQQTQEPVVGRVPDEGAEPPAKRGGGRAARRKRGRDVDPVGRVIREEPAPDAHAVGRVVQEEGETAS